MLRSKSALFSPHFFSIAKTIFFCARAALWSINTCSTPRKSFKICHGTKKSISRRYIVALQIFFFWKSSYLTLPFFFHFIHCHFLLLVGLFYALLFSVSFPVRKSIFHCNFLSIYKPPFFFNFVSRSLHGRLVTSLVSLTGKGRKRYSGTQWAVQRGRTRQQRRAALQFKSFYFIFSTFSNVIQKPLFGQ